MGLTLHLSPYETSKTRVMEIKFKRRYMGQYVATDWQGEGLGEGVEVQPGGHGHEEEPFSRDQASGSFTVLSNCRAHARTHTITTPSIEALYTLQLDTLNPIRGYLSGTQNKDSPFAKLKGGQRTPVAEQQCQDGLAPEQAVARTTIAVAAEKGCCCPMIE